MRLGVSVDIRSIEIVTDEETGHPAVLVTTASSLKPDLMIICEMEPAEPESTDRTYRPTTDEVSMVCNQQLVPHKHIGKIQEAVSAAYGPKAIVQRNAVACSNGPGQLGFDVETADQLARAIVEDLVREKVVSTGLLSGSSLGTGWFGSSRSCSECSTRTK